MKKFTILSMMCLGAILATAQPQKAENIPGTPQMWAIRGAQYPRILPDHSVVFKVNAPTAQTVQADLGKKYDMTKQADGSWMCTTEPQTEGFHYYAIVIDGVRVNDPMSESFYGCSQMTSGIEIPYADGDTRFAMKDVPHGAVQMKRYFSTTANDWRRMYVYTPAGYEESKSKLPVLYLMHGGGEDERGWSTQGLTDIILDNLIAEGKAPKMVIAMLDGNTNDFEKELLNDCIPFVEKSFKVRSDKDGRALAGLSMGGIQTLNTLVYHYDMFGHIGVFSSGWWASVPEFMKGQGMDNEKYYSEIAKNGGEAYNKAFKTLFITMGGKEDIAYNNCQIMMKRFDQYGIKYEYFEHPGGHTWPVWRESIYQFAQRIFK